MTLRSALPRLTAIASLLLAAIAPAQQVTANLSQRLVFAGLRTANSLGQINALASDSSGDIYAAFDQKDGVRVLKLSNDGAALLAQAHLGAAGDSALALSLDPSGNVYLTGTSTSSSLVATTGAAIPISTPKTTNSFVAKFDSSLNELFLTFTGGTRIAAAALAASADAVFVTGITYGADLPVTPTATQQAPAYQSTQNGFVEKFSADGSTLLYATYITGALGDTTPTSIAVDALDDAWLVGSTSASGFATISALVPYILSTPSGFLMRLTPSGDAIAFATFIPGPGLSSIALDSTGQTLLLSGAVSLAQFPVDTITAPILPTSYQVLLRLPLDGSSVLSGTLIAPGSQSVVAPAPNGAAWVAGDFTSGLPPLLPQPALATLGTGYAVRVTPSVGVDQTIRFGGLANQQQTYASLPVLLSGLAVDPSGALVAGGAAQPTASASLLATETYDLPLLATPTLALPSAITDAEIATAACAGSLCSGSAAWLAKVDPTTASAALALSTGDLPFIVLRNLGSGPANALQLTSSTGTLTSNCSSSLAPGGECDALLTGGLAGTLTAAATSTATESVAFPSYTAPGSSIVFYPKELDFGIQTSSSAPAERVLTVSNLGSTTQTFTSSFFGSLVGNPPFLEESSDCPLAGLNTVKSLVPGATCHITLGFIATPGSSNDGTVVGEWTLGSRQVVLTGYSQSAALSLSASEIDFGTEFQSGLRLPRFLYLSNSSSAPVSHTSVSLPGTSPFTVTDGCASTLPASSICQLRIDYLASFVPSTDSVTLNLDQGLDVLLTGLTLPALSGGGSTVDPTLIVSPTSATFGNAVVVTGVSGTTQSIGITNSGASPFPLALALSGDFTDVTSCGATLAAGATCAVAIQFAPAQPGARQGLLTVSAGSATGAASVALSGYGTAILASNNGTLAFGGVPVGQPLVQFYKITQPFSSLTVAASGPYLVTLVEDQGSGPGEPPSSAYLASATGTCHNCWVGVQFEPSAAGAQPGTLTFTSSLQGLPFQLALTGSGLATSGITVTPNLVDFGAIPVGSGSGAVPFTLTNLLDPQGPITLSAPSVTGEFTLENTPAGTAACTSTLAYGASCVVAVIFSPTSAGAQAGTLTLTTSAGTSTVPLTGVGTTPTAIGISPLALTFANSGSTNSATQTVTVTNNGAASVQVGTPTTGTYSFSVTSICAALAPAQSCTLRVTFLPGTAQVNDTLSIPVTSTGSAGTPQTTAYTVALAGTYTAGSVGLQILPASTNYGPTPTLTQGLTTQFAITNSSSSTLALAVTLPRDFVLTTPPCLSLHANTSCTLGVQFVPLTSGDIPGTISVQGTPTGGGSPRTTLAYPEGFGTGSGTLTISGGLIVDNLFNFGQVAVGQTSSQTFTVTNSGAQGSSPVTVRRVTSAPPFRSTSTCGSALAVGASCAVTVNYTPTGQASTSVPSNDTGTLTLESDAQSSPQSLTLEGQPGSGSASSAVLSSFTLTQGSLNFAPTPVGDLSPAQSVTLTNTGTVPIHITSVTATPDFAVQNGCTTVPPQAPAQSPSPALPRAPASISPPSPSPPTQPPRSTSSAWSASAPPHPSPSHPPT